MLPGLHIQLLLLSPIGTGFVTEQSMSEATECFLSFLTWQNVVQIDGPVDQCPNHLSLS